jgi:broad specificity phosphatase PhoE
VTATFHFVRHAMHGLLGRILVGRSNDVPLSPEGYDQTQHLATWFRDKAVSRVYSSPRERARATARAIAANLALAPEITPALDEIDVGAWGGQSFEVLEHDPEWRRWCTARRSARAPAGESMIGVQLRAVGYLEQVRATGPTDAVVLVSHLDVIRAALLHYLGLSLNHYDRIDIAPAGISTLVVGDWGAKLLSLNESALA